MTHDLRILVPEDAIRTRVAALAAELATVLNGVSPLVVGLLDGAFVFTADLVRELARRQVPARVTFMSLASYGRSTRSRGTVTVIRDCAPDEVRQRTVLLVDDILDSGATLQFAHARLIAFGAARVITCVLLDKPSRRRVSFTPDFIGFTIPDAFAVGYGLDHAGEYRGLPWVATLPEGTP
ncbi:MAG: hypoxanthine phosphoribosyltransferase [Magnetococcales bacterium]|nr:hypoxanthine phosphoribosyltransferase [Magnetococcales bacterium]